jgi:hypothetical protein
MNKVVINKIENMLEEANNNSSNAAAGYDEGYYNGMIEAFDGDNYEKGYGHYIELPDGYTIYKGYLTKEPVYEKLFEGTPDKFTIKRLGDDLYNWATHKVSPYMVKPIPNLKEKIKFTTAKIFDWYCNEFKRTRNVTDNEDKIIGVINIINAKEICGRLLKSIETDNYIGFNSFDIIMINKIWNWYVENCSNNSYVMHFDDGDSMMTEQWLYYFKTNIKHQNNINKEV